MLRLKKKDLELLSELRKNGRTSLTDLAKIIDVPVSTIHDKIKKNNYIDRYVCLFNRELLGFSTSAIIIIRVKRENKQNLGDYLKKSKHVNNLFKINSGYDYLLEGVFENVKELEMFLEEIKDIYKVKSADVLYIIDELLRENFFTSSFSSSEV